MANVQKETAKLLGINADTTTCQCCGKKNLKRVFVILMPDGQILSMGSSCGIKALGKGIAGKLDSMVELTAFVRKCEAYGYSSVEINKGISWKMGYSSVEKSGGYEVYGVGFIPGIELLSPTVSWWAD